MANNVIITNSYGDHQLRVFQKIVTAWNPEDKEASIFRDKITEELNKLIAQYPSLDTGYFAIASSETYIVDHKKFYRIPMRADFYYSSSGNPKSGDLVYRMFPDWSLSTGNGIRVSHSVDGSYTKIETGTITSGFLRALIWG